MSTDVSTRRAARDQPILAGIALGAMLLVLPILIVAGHLNLFTIPGVLLAAGLMVAGRDSLHPLGGLGVAVLLWATSGADRLSAWSLAVAILLLVSHTAAALRSSVPPYAALDATLVRRWLVRSVAVAGLTVLVYLSAVAVDGLDRGGETAVVVLAFAVLIGLALLLRHETLAGG